MSDVSVIVTTFERGECVQELLESLHHYHPDWPVIVADNGKEPIKVPGYDFKHVLCPFDCGLAKARNLALEHVETPMFLLCDDDYVILHETHTEKLAQLVRDGVADLAGGDYRPEPDQKWKDYHGVIEWEPKKKRMRLHREALVWHGDYAEVDITQNFFVARTAAVKGIFGWDNDLKLQEHIDFFFRFKKAGHTCVYVPECRVWHKQRGRTDRYKQYRHRSFHRVMLRKLHVKRLEVYGRVFTR